MTPPGLALCAVSPQALARGEAVAELLPRLGADAEGAGEARRAVHARRPRSSSRSTSRSGCSSTRGSRRRSSATSASAAPAAPARRRWGSSSSRPDDDRSAVVTAIRAPEGIDSGDVVSGVRKRFGMTLANGQGSLKGRIFRIGHIGWFDVFDITTALAAVELVLAELGADIERGAAVTAALEAYEHANVSRDRQGPRPRVDRRRGRRAAARALRRRRRRRQRARRRSSAATTRSSSARRRSSRPS